MLAERAWQVAHEELHARIHRLHMDAQPTTVSGTASYRRSLIDPKTLIPDAFSGEPKGQPWRDWSYRVKSYVGSVQPTLQNAMERTEHKSTPVLETEFANLNIDPSIVNEFKAMLTQKTTGYAHTIIRQHDMSIGLGCTGVWLNILSQTQTHGTSMIFNKFSTLHLRPPWRTSHANTLRGKPCTRFGSTASGRRLSLQMTSA